MKKTFIRTLMFLAFTTGAALADSGKSVVGHYEGGTFWPTGCGYLHKKCPEGTVCENGWCVLGDDDTNPNSGTECTASFHCPLNHRCENGYCR